MTDKRGQDENFRIKHLIELKKQSLPPDGGSDYNRLIFASSPYLLQHADNPVAWWQWGDDAFSAAKAEDKPVFLSIGYATCHWCHVMAHESFSDPEVAALLNQSYISIKVDREERPDLDDQYMAVSQLLTGSGGWPLNLILTPERKPFYAFTYLPKFSQGGMIGLIRVLDQISDAWHTKRDKVEESAASIIESLQRTVNRAPANPDPQQLSEKAFKQLTSIFDKRFGGFGSAPKFPMPPYLLFLLRYCYRTGSEEAGNMVKQTLRTIRGGGIYDQIGFGFHRYSVDRQWQTPHFEKMLYDQALLASVYLEACKLFKDNSFCIVAAEIFSYLLKEMSDLEGGFYSAMDADSEGEEGTFYLWSRSEIGSAVGEAAAGLCCSWFGVSEQGNFEGENILQELQTLEEFCAKEGISSEQLATERDEWRRKLYSARSTRIPPLTDRKILTAWNGLMIASLACGYAISGNEKWLAAAQRCADFISRRLISPDGRLLRSYHMGKAIVPGFLEDYAFYIHGLLSIYEATLAPDRLNAAINLSREMFRLFHDPESGALRETGSDGEQLLIPNMTSYDGVIPSGNSMAALVLLKLGRITDDPSLIKAAEGILQALSGRAETQPSAHLFMLLAQDLTLEPTTDITLVGPSEAAATKEMLRVIGQRYLPGLVLRHMENETVEMPMLHGLTTAYICAASACRPAVAEAEALATLLDTLE